MQSPTEINDTSETEFFEISAVARLTGISSHLLRVWERRYQVVEPNRSESKRRQYTGGNIQRLSLLKALVDNGHSIGSIAPLSTDQLEERLSSVLDAQGPINQADGEVHASVCRLGVVGSTLKKAVREASDSTPALQIVGEFSKVDDLVESLRPGAIDLIVIEADTLFPEDIESIQQLTETMQVRRAILVYWYAQGELIDLLDIKKITALRGPVDAAEIKLACIADIQLALRAVKTVPDQGQVPVAKVERSPVDIPERRFSSEELVRIAGFSSVIKCECPQQLANLLSSVTAFEKYSEQCEDRNDADAEMHRYLHETTATARATLETALAELMREEGIEI
ncbi:MerR family transcriptional regulator [Verrucomicrobiales bacterium]|jgi:MerR family transcriptional regulator, light-induced transcriptional regulator|nr:MerR family transcriptional regulator [Verrucomicrobiales bacterium]